jgi:hypothetical protein
MSARAANTGKAARKAPTTKKELREEWRPVSVVTREGKTTIRQFQGRRFVRFGEVRGKKVAWVEFFTAGPNIHSISVRFQDQTVFHLEITPLFTLKPEYYSLKTGDMVTLKEWPEIRNER